MAAASLDRQRQLDDGRRGRQPGRLAELKIQAGQLCLTGQKTKEKRKQKHGLQEAVRPIWPGLPRKPFAISIQQT
jgi:hypothetical protein